MNTSSPDPDLDPGISDYYQCPFCDYQCPGQSLRVQRKHYDRKHRNDGKKQSFKRQGESFSKEAHNHAYYEMKKQKHITIQKSTQSQTKIQTQRQIQLSKIQIQI